MNRTYGETLWIECATKRLNDAILPNIPISKKWIPSPYIYLGLLIFLDAVVLNFIQYMRFGTAVLIDNPSWILLPLTVVLGLFANRYMRDRYAEAIEEIQIDRRVDGTTEGFDRLVPADFKRNIFFLFLTVYYTYLFVSGRIFTIVTYEGMTGLIGWLLIGPIGYGLILIETAIMYFSLHFFLPRRFNKYDVKIDFFDTQNLGGLQPVGEILKNSYYLFNTAVILFTVMLYAPFLLSRYLYTPYNPPDILVVSVVFILWGVGVLSIGYSFWKLHQYMRNARRNFLSEFDKRLDHMISNRYEVDPKDDEMRQWFERRKHIIEEARQTREFPAHRLVGIKMLLSAIFPILIEITIRSFISI